VASDLWDIVLNWVREEQRQGRLSNRWTSMMSYNGDKILALSRMQRHAPNVVIFEDRFEAHEWVMPRMTEVTATCQAAEPTFFDQLRKVMQEIEGGSNEP